jgi:soluble lytic murein transglycosylase-like protein
MPKNRRILGAALLTAAATALAVKETLAGPLGAVVPADELQRELGATKDAALSQSQAVLAHPQERLAGALVRAQSSPAAVGSKSPREAGSPAHESLETRAVRRSDRLDPRPILREAALRHQLDPKLVLAVSYWESGWDQSRVSQTGAVGLMQVEPATAQEAGPALLGRVVDITDPFDNADVGAAVLKEDLDAFHDTSMALAAYYQGPTSLRAHGMFPDTQQYVQGILDLAARMN